ncbi:MAG: hypothetical protein ABIT58_03035 [Ferruginibacter sp.]
MTTTQLFLKINKPGLTSEWTKNVTALLKETNAIDIVFVIGNNEESIAEINISYDAEAALLDEIVLIITNEGATCIELNIHLPQNISGTSDPYGASAIALPVEELQDIKGVLASGISEKGEIKLLLDPNEDNKQSIIDKLSRKLSLIRIGK